MHLDLGQRNFGFATCAVCGMMYGKGLPEEERLHDQFHNAHTAAFKFQGWASERVVLREGARGRLLCVIPSDPKPQQRKAGELCGQLEKALGLPQGYLLAPEPPYKVFFWVSGGGGGSGGGSGGSGSGTRDRITGVLVAQLQERARWAQLTPSTTPAQPRRPSQQRDRSGAQQPSRITAAVSAAAAAPATPAADAAAEVEVDPDGDGGVTAGDSTDAGGRCGRDATGGPQQRAARAAAAAAIGRVAAYPSCSMSMSTRRQTGQVGGLGLGGDPAAKRPRLQEMTHGSAAACCDDTCSTGPASASAAAETVALPCAEATAEGPSAASWQPSATAAGSGPAAAAAATAAAPPPGTPAPAPARARLPHALPQPQPPCCALGGNTSSGGSDGARVRVVLGVRGLWVEPGWRRRGVATRLMDAARCCMVPGVAAERSAVSFSACAAAAASGDDDGGAAFAAFAASYLRGGGVGPAGGGDGDGGYSGQSAFSVLLYDDDE
ncbi:hypothetical protein PLESTM_001779000 [Pleodorina starrii]|nr:hypothetical protein PLESTM_001779000 [Pleodorina starrii]